MATEASTEAPPTPRLRAGRAVDQNALATRVAPRIRAERLVRLERVVAERVRREAEESGLRVATLNHELRTPLSLVIGYTEMLLSGVAGPLSDEQARMLRRVEAGGARLHELVEELLRISIDGAQREAVVDVGAEVVRILGDPAAARGCPGAPARTGVPTLER